MRSWREVAALTVASLLLQGGCRREPAGEGGGARGGTIEVRALLDEGRFEEVISRLGEAHDPESLCLLGRAWAGRARSAPVPTPPAGAGPEEAPLKTEEMRALGLLERAVAERPNLAEAHLAIAELLAPHALGRSKALRSGGTVTPVSPPAPDTSVERVLRSLSNAAEADPAGTAAAEALVEFATHAGRLKEADAAYQELIRRRREDPNLLVRYGDFLAGPRGDPEAALSQYSQALIWRPRDEGTRGKVAGIHLDAAAAALRAQGYALAEARLREAQRFATEANPEVFARLRELESRLREIRGR